LSSQRMIRKGDYKMILYPEGNIVRLYNLREDPDEIHDLARDPSSRPLLESLFLDFQALAREQADPINISASFRAFLEQYSSYD